MILSLTLCYLMQEVNVPHTLTESTIKSMVVHVLVKMIHVLAEASEAETAGIFLGAQGAVPPCSTLWWNWDTLNLLVGTP